MAVTGPRAFCASIAGLLLSGPLALCLAVPKNAFGIAAPYGPKTALGDFSINPDTGIPVFVVSTAACIRADDPAATTQAPGVEVYGFRY